MQEPRCKKCDEKLNQNGISLICKKCKRAYMYVHYANSVELVEFDEIRKRLQKNLESLEELSKEFLPIMEAPLNGFGGDEKSREHFSRAKHAYDELHTCLYTTSEMIEKVQDSIAIEDDELAKSFE